VGLENKIPEQNDVQIIGEYKATMFGFGKYEKGLSPTNFLEK
jgi:hypothetical protein